MKYITSSGGANYFHNFHNFQGRGFFFWPNHCSCSEFNKLFTSFPVVEGSSDCGPALVYLKLIVYHISLYIYCTSKKWTSKQKLHSICTNLSPFAEYFVTSSNIDIACNFITKSMKIFHGYCHKYFWNYWHYFCYFLKIAQTKWVWKISTKNRQKNVQKLREISKHEHKYSKMCKKRPKNTHQNVQNFR